jgi:Txe/YoeB family toxin of toxin-antitoxin system
VNLVFSLESWEEYLYWQRTDPQTLKRIHHLIKHIMRDPYRGIGKPEPLKHAFQVTGHARLPRSIASFIVSLAANRGSRNCAITTAD